LKSRVGRKLDTSLDLQSGLQSFKFTLLENPEESDSEGGQ
jgi:hypothetical protein